MFGLPLGSTLALAGIVALPVLAYGLYRIDIRRADGHITLLGYRPPSSE